MANGSGDGSGSEFSAGAGPGVTLPDESTSQQSDETATETASDTASETVDETTEVASGFVDNTDSSETQGDSSSPRNAFDTATGEADETTSSAEETASETVDETTETVSEGATDEASDVAEETQDVSDSVPSEPQTTTEERARQRQREFEQQFSSSVDTGAEVNESTLEGGDTDVPAQTVGQRTTGYSQTTTRQRDVPGLGLNLPQQARDAAGAVKENVVDPAANELDRRTDAFSENPQGYILGGIDAISQPFDVAKRATAPARNRFIDTASAAEAQIRDTAEPITNPVVGVVDTGIDTAAEVSEPVREPVVEAGEDAAGTVREKSEDAQQTFNEEVSKPIAEGFGEQMEESTDDLAETVRDTGAEDSGDVIEESSDDVGRVSENVARGAGDTAGQIIGAPATTVRASDMAGETASDAAGTIGEEGTVEGGAELIAQGEQQSRTAAYGAAATAIRNPARTTGGLVSGYLAGAAASRGVGVASRGVGDRVRTVGGDKIDADTQTQREVLDGDEDFPGAQNPELYRERPAEAVRQQADEMTAEELEQRFDEAGVEGDAVMKKAVDTEPEGPGRGRAAQGFESQVGSYESPGSFWSPELSPNFLRTGESSSMSLKPGLPDIGGKPTAVAARMDVEESDASSLSGFADELRSREGEPTAITKPRSELNTGEIEAVTPPGATFRDIGGGRVRNTLRRFGIGSDYYTEIEGRRVPIRTVRPDRDSDTDTSTADLDADDATPAFTDKDLSEITSRPRQPRDDTTPVPPSASPTSGTTTGGQSPTASSGVDSRVSDSQQDATGGSETSGESLSETVSDAFDYSLGSGVSPRPSDSRSTGSDAGDRSGPSSSPSDRDSGPTSPSGTGSGSGGSSGFDDSTTSSFPPSGSGGGSGSSPTSGSSSPGGSGPPSGSSPTGGGGSGGSPTAGPTGGSSATGSSGLSYLAGAEPTSRPRLPDPDADEDEDEFEPLFAGQRNPFGTDFRDPLTGDVLNTNLNVGDVTDLETQD